VVTITSPCCACAVLRRQEERLLHIITTGANSPAGRPTPGKPVGICSRRSRLIDPTTPRAPVPTPFTAARSPAPSMAPERLLRTLRQAIEDASPPLIGSRCPGARGRGSALQGLRITIYHPTTSLTRACSPSSRRQHATSGRGVAPADFDRRRSWAALRDPELVRGEMRSRLASRRYRRLPRRPEGSTISWRRGSRRAYTWSGATSRAPTSRAPRPWRPRLKGTPHPETPSTISPLMPEKHSKYPIRFGCDSKCGHAPRRPASRQKGIERAERKPLYRA